MSSIFESMDVAPSYEGYVLHAAFSEDESPHKVGASTGGECEYLFIISFMLGGQIGMPRIPGPPQCPFTFHYSDYIRVRTVPNFTHRAVMIFQLCCPLLKIRVADS